MIGALVSGESRVAVFFEGAQAWCVHPDSRVPQQVSQGQLPYLFGDLAQGTHHPDASLESTQELLKKACDAERGLQLALISIDSESSDATCELAEDALEEFLEDAYVSEFIENRLSTKCLPLTARWLKSAKDYSAMLDLRFPKVALLRNGLVAAQASIGIVRKAWDTLPETLFVDKEERSHFESALEKTGAFLALTRAAGDKTGRYSKGDAQFRMLSERRHQEFANWRNILVEWTKAIPTATGKPTRHVEEEPQVRGHRSARAVTPPVASYEAFQNVVLQKDAIIEQLSKRNFNKVEVFVADLVKHQLLDERPDLAAKSLCDLAQVAKKRGFVNYHMEWLLLAKEIFPEDPFVRNQIADALLRQGHLTEALEEYESSVQTFPQNVFGRNGNAVVLKALGRLPEALAAFESTVQDFPRNVPGRNGSAEVLKALGRLPEALAAYESTVLEFPQDIVARVGRAEVLKALNRLPEALTAYESTVRDFPQNVMARAGMAEVLKALNRLPEALAAYESTVRDFPQDVVARVGMAEVSKALGRLPEALAAYESTVRDFPQNVMARAGMAEVLKALNRLPEAFAAYESTVRDFPQDVVVRIGMAEVLRGMGRLLEALNAYEFAAHDFPGNFRLRAGKAEVLRALGRLPEALTAYESTVQDLARDVVVRAGNAEVLSALSKLPEARTAYESTVKYFTQGLEARTGKAEVLRAMDRLPEALDEYESTITLLMAA